MIKPRALATLGLEEDSRFVAYLGFVIMPSIPIILDAIKYAQPRTIKGRSKWRISRH